MLGGNLSHLPSDVIHAIVKALRTSLSIGALPVLITLSPYSSNFTIKHAYPPTLFFSCLRRLAVGVSEIRCQSVVSRDELLETLAASPAAPTLLKLNLQRCQLSDACVPCLAAFKSVESIKVGPAVSKAVISAILCVPSANLRRLELPSSLVSPIDILEEIVSKKLKIARLKLRCSADSTTRALEVEKLMKILRSNLEFACGLERISIDHWDGIENKMLDECLRGLRSTAANFSKPPRTVKQFPPVSLLLPPSHPGVPEPSVVTQELLNAIAARFPALKELRLRMDGWTATDLSVLPCLATLKLNVMALEALPVSWPTSLRLLDLTSSFVIGPASAETLLASICPKMPQLTSLYVRITSSFSAEAIERLLSELPQLRRLQLLIGSDSSVFHLSHPNLRAIPSFNSLDVKTGFLPRLKHAIQRSHFPSSSLSPGQVPGLRSIDFLPSSIDFDLMKRLPLLQRVVVADPRHSASASAPSGQMVSDELMTLTQIRHLACYDCANTGDFWYAYCKANPRLTSLSLSFTALGSPNGRPIVQDLSFLQLPMPFMNQLALTLGSPFPSAPLDSLKMSGVSHQCLVDVRIDLFHNAIIREISFNGLPNLLRLTLSRDSFIPYSELTSVSVADCPRLLEIFVRALSISSLTLRNLGHLCIATFEGNRFDVSTASTAKVKMESMVHVSGVPPLPDKAAGVFPHDETNFAQRQAAELLKDLLTGK